MYRYKQCRILAAAAVIVPLAAACGSDQAGSSTRDSATGVTGVTSVTGVTGVTGATSATGATAATGVRWKVTVRLAKEADAPLYGTRWTVTALGTRGTATSLPEGDKPYLTFDQGSGRVTGSLGCNHVSARATVRDGHITLGVPVTTRMMCVASLMDTEKSLLRLFNGTATYRIDHRRLVLTSENGETVTAVAKK